MITYRPFRNYDPPAIVEVWNDAFAGRGASLLRTPAVVERWIASRPFFDPSAFVLAFDGDRPVGFVLSGPGSNADASAEDRQIGVTCLLAVIVDYRRKGIGSELLLRSQNYLRRNGATTLLAGAMKPHNPYTFGIYGGSDSPGFLTSDQDAAPFLEYHGYQGAGTTLVFQRRIEGPLNIADARFGVLRRKYDLQIVPKSVLGSWWQEVQFGTMEPVEFRLDDKLTGQPMAAITVWEMEGYSWRWNTPAAGILDLYVDPEARRAGLGKFLVSQLLKYLQEQFFGIVEVQITERNQPAIALFRSVGFEPVDAGRTYKVDPRYLDPLDDDDE
ncbi:GNAT family N-acetyltransferase [Tuwongella immobilis]|uniref:N-acetyltransferase domain-containing protein n=1 Tax=Tuwongella immobilis TaxID=692036 RepID=A0A6C2YPZ4_9BACT|nr:GNAT family N-acetyltransferase [Tuwongella immobilis]VIP03249.1 n-acetyltransferase gcn5 : Uncharacterized protein OS=Planctomyces maris DSM 8797 GN=PM8797T_13418 PE=4 SV=1: Acetyltransf_9: Acetyltransf_1 [Tuwongella immobilis]VTS03834.1 n-acetyltransferase gcn5 : Uncharacterized protein OS=Planctomyces maris DSM 8797 GN=PM8797T_13418 PE=4 SV=1: Acetyltransf_9: Acetyltransf_1 [Tuwongella immobilis]